MGQKQRARAKRKERAEVLHRQRAGRGGKFITRKDLKKAKLKDKLKGKAAGKALKGSAGSGDGTVKKRGVRYDTSQRILVLGDGDFSFSRGLVDHLDGIGTGVVATSYDSKEEVLEKYRSAATYLGTLVKKGVEVHHWVDATRLGTSEVPFSGPFDRIIWNFPHSGQQRVHKNRTMLLKFFQAARTVIAPKGGEVHVTIMNAPPYSLWGLVGLAEDGGWRLLREAIFDPASFPGYRHKTTLAEAAPVDMRKVKLTSFAFGMVPGAPVVAIKEEAPPAQVPPSYLKQRRALDDHEDDVSDDDADADAEGDGGSGGRGKGRQNPGKRKRLSGSEKRRRKQQKAAAGASGS